jgi:hypothetical protein
VAAAGQLDGDAAGAAAGVEHPVARPQQAGDEVRLAVHVRADAASSRSLVVDAPRDPPVSSSHRLTHRA